MNKIFVYSVGLIATIIFSFTSTTMASLYILGSLGGSDTTAWYTIAIFGIANGTSVPLGLTYGGRFGRLAMTQACLICFILATFCLGLSPNYPTFLVFRFLQGFFSGPLLVLIPSLLTNLATNEEILGFTRNIAIVFICISIIATCIGGTIAYFSNWRWLFLLDGIIPALLFYPFNNYLKDKQFPINEKPFDLFGYLAYFIAIWSISLFFILGQQLDWLTSSLLVSLLITFTVSLPIFFLQSLSHPNPIVHFPLLKSYTMMMALIQLGILFGTYYGLMYLLSTWLHIYVNYTPDWINLVLGAMLLSAFIIMLIIHLLKIGNSSEFLLIGLIFIFLGAFSTMHFNSEVNFGRIAISRLIEGVGFALFLPPLLYMILSSSTTPHRFDALTLFHMVRTIGCGLGISAFATTWQRRTAFYHQRLGSQLTPFSELVDRFFTQTKNYFLTPEMSLQGLESALTRQSVSLALNDCFYLIAVLMVLLIALTIGYMLLLPALDGKKISNDGMIE